MSAKCILIIHSRLVFTQFTSWNWTFQWWVCSTHGGESVLSNNSSRFSDSISSSRCSWHAPV